MEDSPSFASEREEAAHYRQLYREIKEELDEYKETSADYERELETELGMLYELSHVPHFLFFYITSRSLRFVYFAKSSKTERLLCTIVVVDCCA